MSRPSLSENSNIDEYPKAAEMVNAVAQMEVLARPDRRNLQWMPARAREPARIERICMNMSPDITIPARDARSAIDVDLLDVPGDPRR